MSAGRFFYFNGFNSAIPTDWRDNPKIAGVRSYARDCGFEFQPLSIDFRRAESLCREIVDSICQDERRVVFCGSSMGGWFARIAQLRLAQAHPGVRTDAVAFNPAFSLGQYGGLLIGPQENFVTGETYRWTARDSGRLTRLEHSVHYDSPLPFYVYVDRGDEVIGWKQSEERHAAMTRFRIFEGGCHSFDHYREALLDYDALSADQNTAQADVRVETGGTT